MVIEKQPSKDGVKKKRIRSKSTRRVQKLSPFQERLRETDVYTKPKFEEFINISNVKDRLVLINSLLSEDETDISRVWPLQIKTKDSRLRRELSEKGKECFVKGQNDKVLQFYNDALLYSSGKGIAHTLARRAAFFLSTEEYALAIRDLSIALEYGCLETELLDFLLVHHTEDEEENRVKNDQTIESAIDSMKSAKIDMQTASAGDISKWAEEIRQNLSLVRQLKKENQGSKKIKDDIIKKIINSIKQASKEANINDNIEIEELEVPEIKERNPLCPAYSEAAAISSDPDKGRIVKARRDIMAGEIICVDDPVVSMLCPQDKTNIRSHCLTCFRYTRAPISCDTCCSVVFCSPKCKLQATKGFHKWECQLKLYELFENEGRDIFGLFMALRAVTQKPVQYFTDNQKEIEKFLELDEPTFPFPGRAYQSSDYRALCNLMTHVGDIDEDVALKNSVLTIFFHRFLKTSGYFSHMSVKGKGGRGPTNFDIFMLRLIHQIICAQTYNAHSVHKITKTFNWELIGTAINPSLALVNHSCDSNALRCSVNRGSILVAARHIPEGEEITDTYCLHYRDSDINQRQYTSLKNYMFACECPACKKNWPQEEDVPDELYRIPTFEQEKVYKVRHGDKKLIVTQIIQQRRAVEENMTKKKFSDALQGYQKLCKTLEDYLAKPHLYFLQARSGISHCVWNLYCTQFPEKPIEEPEEHNMEYSMDRAHANQIYKSNLTEQVNENNALDFETTDVVNQMETDKPVDAEKAALLESTKRLLEASSHKVANALKETEYMKQTYADERNIAKQTNEVVSHITTGKIDDINFSHNNGIHENKVDMLQKTDVGQNEKLLQKPQEPKCEVEEKERQIRLEKKKEWEEEDIKRKERENQRKSLRNKELEERVKRAAKEEKKKRELKKKAESEKKRKKEEEHNKLLKIEEETRKKLHEVRDKKKKEEEDELEKLLAAIDGDVTDIGEDLLHSNNQTNETSTPAASKKPEINIKGNNEVHIHNLLPVRIISDGHNINGIQQTQNNDTKQLKPQVNLQEKEDNVWSSIRQIKDLNSNVNLLKESEKKEKISITDINLMIENLSDIIEERKQVPPSQNRNLFPVEEENKENDSKESSDLHILSKIEEENIQNFDYDKWKSDVDRIFSAEPEFSFVKDAKDEAYLHNLRIKVKENVDRQTKDLDKKSKKKIKTADIEEKELKQEVVRKTDDFAILKLKEKERKKRKQEDKFNQKVSTSKDKLKEMSLKSQKMEKIMFSSEEEIKKMKEKAKLMVAKSEQNEKQFSELFDDIENIDKIITESGKKNGRKISKSKENTKKIPDVNDLHWTEEESSKWNSQKSSDRHVSDVLTALKAAADKGNSTQIAASLKDTIKNCQQIEKDDKEEANREKIKKQEKILREKEKLDALIKTKQNISKINEKDKQSENIMKNDVFKSSQNLSSLTQSNSMTSESINFLMEKTDSNKIRNSGVDIVVNNNFNSLNGFSQNTREDNNKNTITIGDNSHPTKSNNLSSSVVKTDENDIRKDTLNQRSKITETHFAQANVAKDKDEVFFKEIDNVRKSTNVEKTDSKTDKFKKIEEKKKEEVTLGKKMKTNNDGLKDKNKTSSVVSNSDLGIKSKEVDKTGNAKELNRLSKKDDIPLKKSDDLIRKQTQSTRQNQNKKDKRSKPNTMKKTQEVDINVGDDMNKKEATMLEPQEETNKVTNLGNSFKPKELEILEGTMQMQDAICDQLKEKEKQLLEINLESNRKETKDAPVEQRNNNAKCVQNSNNWQHDENVTAEKRSRVMNEKSSICNLEESRREETNDKKSNENVSNENLVKTQRSSNDGKPVARKVSNVDVKSEFLNVVDSISVLEEEDDDSLEEEIRRIEQKLKEKDQAKKQFEEELLVQKKITDEELRQLDEEESKEREEMRLNAEINRKKAAELTKAWVGDQNKIRGLSFDEQKGICNSKVVRENRIPGIEWNGVEWKVENGVEWKVENEHMLKNDKINPNNTLNEVEKITKGQHSETMCDNNNEMETQNGKLKSSSKLQSMETKETSHAENKNVNGVMPISQNMKNDTDTKKNILIPKESVMEIKSREIKDPSNSKEGKTFPQLKDNNKTSNMESKKENNSSLHVNNMERKETNQDENKTVNGVQSHPHNTKEDSNTKQNCITQEETVRVFKSCKKEDTPNSKEFRQVFNLKENKTSNVKSKEENIAIKIIDKPNQSMKQNQNVESKEENKTIQIINKPNQTIKQNQNVANNIKSKEESSEIKIIGKPNQNQKVATNIESKEEGNEIKIINKPNQTIKQDRKITKNNGNFPDKSSEAKLQMIDSNSFVPTKNSKSEIEILKIGSPSMIRKAIHSNVNIKSSVEIVESQPMENYKITRVPTTIFEIKCPSPKLQSKNYEITRVPTTHIDMDSLSKNYCENIKKYSESKTEKVSIRKRSGSVPRPPPPSCKPPPPPCTPFVKKKHPLLPKIF